MTTGAFRYLDPATLATSSEDGSRLKPWAKVDIDVTSFNHKKAQRNVANIRDESDSNFGIDISGFGVYRAPAPVDTKLLLQDDAVVRGAYYDSVEAILRAQLPGVRKVVIFDHTIRIHKPDASRQPVQQVHVDQTPKAAESRVRRHVPDPEVENLLAGRYQLVNVWRPIGHEASDFPLAVVDWRTTDPEDLIAVDLLYPKRDAEKDDGDDRGKEVRPDPTKAMSTEGYEVKGETYAIAPNEKHKFYYCKDMQPDEVMFIKCYDSRSEGQPGGKTGIAALTPHTAFIDPQSPEGAKPRQSIEVRCLIFYD